MTALTMPVLDHGFVTLRILAGPTRRTQTIFDGQTLDDSKYAVIPRPFDADDIDPAHAARMSFEQMDSDRTYEQDMKLNEYLLLNDHTSPLEMIQVWIEIKVPIFIDRQMVRHRTWSRNESSARYITLPGEWYIPEVVGGKSSDKKQGQEDNLPATMQAAFKQRLNETCKANYGDYLFYLHHGVAPEHARMFLHLNHYVHWVGSVNLANLFRFLRLRTHDHAQIEARVYGEAIVDLLRPHLPGLMGLFDKHCRKVS